MSEQGLVVFKGAGSLTTESVATIRELGALFYQSGLFPDVQSEAQAAIKIMHGMTYGWSPTYSMKNVYIISAKKPDGTWYPPSVEVSAQAMAGLVRRSRDYEYAVAKLNESECEIDFRFKGKLAGVSRWTRADAERAELVNRGKQMYLKYPKSMYFAGAMRNGVRMFCADLLQGYGLQVSPLEDLSPEALEADMDIVDVESKVEPEDERLSEEELEREKSRLFGAEEIGTSKPVGLTSCIGTESWTDAPTERPWDAATIKAEVARRVEWNAKHPKWGASAGKKPTQDALDFLRTLAGQTMPDDGKRHDVYLHLLGIDSSSKMTAGQVSSLIWWMKNGTSGPNQFAAKEAEACVTARRVEMGQGSLFDQGDAGSVEV